MSAVSFQVFGLLVLNAFTENIISFVKCCSKAFVLMFGATKQQPKRLQTISFFPYSVFFCTNCDLTWLENGTLFMLHISDSVFLSFVRFVFFVVVVEKKSHNQFSVHLTVNDVMSECVCVFFFCSPLNVATTNNFNKFSFFIFNKSLLNVQRSYNNCTHLIHTKSKIKKFI